MKESDPRLKVVQKELAENAVETGKAFNVDLDYSVESLYKVENILGAVHNELHLILKRRDGKASVRGISKNFGAYIIEVIERNLTPGWWEVDHPTFGKESFPYYLTDQEIVFPVGWCMNRIEGGPTENVWAKFQIMILKKPAKKGISRFFKFG